jgi:serine/threonine protein kinase
MADRPCVRVHPERSLHQGQLEATKRTGYDSNEKQTHQSLHAWNLAQCSGTSCHNQMQFSGTRIGMSAALLVHAMPTNALLHRWMHRLARISGIPLTVRIWWNSHLASSWHSQDIKDIYEFVEPLGTGGFAKVFKGHNKSTGEDVAIKHIALLECASSTLASLTMLFHSFSCAETW